MGSHHDQAHCPQCKKRLGASREENTQAFCPRCRFPLLTIAGKYRLTEEIAEGGFGTVYKAQHIGLERTPQRAIKLLKPKLFEQESATRRFQREIQITAELSLKNRHIVRIFDDFGEIEHLGTFYVMEYLEGQSLRQWLTSHERPPALEDCERLFLQLCSAMQTAHEAGVLHRDLKPSNLMIVQEERSSPFLKVLDFGIAKHLDESATSALTKGALGTPAYMSPEQCLHKHIDERSDIYNMGLLLYTLLTLEHPFAPTSQQRDEIHDWCHAHITRKAPALAAKRASLPQGLEDVVAKALAKRPKQRYASVRALEDAFREAMQTPAKSERKPQKAPQNPFMTEEHTEDPPPTPKQRQEYQAKEAALTPPTSSPVASANPAPAAQHPEANPVAGQPPAPQALPPTGTVARTSTPRHFMAPALFVVIGVLLAPLVWRLVPAFPPQQPTRTREQKPPKTRTQQTHSTKTRQPSGTSPQARKKTPHPKPSTPKQGSHIPKNTLRTTSPQPTPRVRTIRNRKAAKRSQAPKHKAPRKRATKRPPPKKRKRRSRGLVRKVKGCPNTALYWSYITLPKSQRGKVQARLPKGRALGRPDGYCLGVKHRRTEVTLGPAGRFFPCSFKPAALPPKTNIRLQAESFDVVAPTAAHYCLRIRP